MHGSHCRTPVPVSNPFEDYGPDDFERIKLLSTNLLKGSNGINTPDYTTESSKANRARLEAAHASGSLGYDSHVEIAVHVDFEWAYTTDGKCKKEKRAKIAATAAAAAEESERLQAAAEESERLQLENERLQSELNQAREALTASVPAAFADAADNMPARTKKRTRRTARK